MNASIIECVLNSRVEKREWIAELRNDSKQIKKLNDKLEVNINVLQQEVDR